MKIVLFSPALKNSAIGRMASLVSRKLIEYGHEITVVRCESADLFNQPVHNFGVEPITWRQTDEIRRIIESSDISVYQIGDAFNFHEGCLYWLPFEPGIVCLHDFFLGNLFYGWAQKNVKAAQAILYTWYGVNTAKKFFKYNDIDSFIEETRNICPLTEWVSSKALSVMTHSSWGINRVLNSCPGPVWVVPLAYDAPPVAEQVKLPKQLYDKLCILTVGHVNKNKRAASVIKAIGQSEMLRKKSIYHLVGYINPQMKQNLTSLAKSMSVDLLISGEVDGVTLAAAISRADVVTCFRSPVLEAASASTIEALLYGKLIMINNAGFYNEIPDEFAIKIDQKHEICEISKSLEKIIIAPTQYTELKLRAQRWAQNTFTSDNYALKLIELASDTLKTKSINKSIKFFSESLYRWGGSKDTLKNSYVANPLAIFENI